MAEQKYPEPTVGALIFNKEGKLLLMKSPKWFDKFVIPGGHVELGEKIEDAVKREVKEEVGLDVFDTEFIHVVQFIFDKDFHEKRHFIGFQYACKTDSTKIKTNSEVSSYVWVSLDESLKLPLVHYVKETIMKYMKKKGRKA